MTSRCLFADPNHFEILVLICKMIGLKKNVVTYFYEFLEIRPKFCIFVWKMNLIWQKTNQIGVKVTKG